MNLNALEQTINAIIARHKSLRATFKQVEGEPVQIVSSMEKIKLVPLVSFFFSGRIAVFRARRQPHNRIRDLELGWGKLARGGVDVHFIPGDHDSVLKEPRVQGLATALKKCLR